MFLCLCGGVFPLSQPHFLSCRCIYEGLLTALGALARYDCPIMTLSLILWLGQIKNDLQTASCTHTVLLSACVCLCVAHRLNKLNPFFLVSPLCLQI